MNILTVVANESYQAYAELLQREDGEIDFVQTLRDNPQVVFYFKFPPAFKVALPRQIGNYNPDWASRAKRMRASSWTTCARPRAASASRTCNGRTKSDLSRL